MGHAQGRRLAPLPTVALFLSLRQSDVCALPFHVTQAPCLCPSISSEHPSGRAHCSHVPAAAHDARRAASAIALRTRTLPTPFFPRPRVCPALQPMPRAILVPSIYLTSAPRPSPGGWYASLCPPLSSPALVQCAFLCIVSPRRTIPHHCHPYIRSRTARNPLKSPPPPLAHALIQHPTAHAARSRATPPGPTRTLFSRAAPQTAMPTFCPFISRADPTGVTKPQQVRWVCGGLCWLDV